MPKRQLVALMFSDVVGYGSITTLNESLALELLDEYRVIVRRFLSLYGGRENKTIGDGFFVEFGSALEAVRCAIEIQTCLYERNLGVPDERRLTARIGIHLGDVVLSDGDSFGEGVNLAARIEGFAEPGGICVSRSVADQLFPYDQIRLQRIGKRALKHINHPTTLYKVKLPWQKKRASVWPWKWRRGRRAPGTRRSVRSEWWMNLAQEILLSCVLALFSYVAVRTIEDFQSYAIEHGVRTIASTPTPRVSLRGNWQYALAPFTISPDAEGIPGYVEWNDLRFPFSNYADKLKTPYWMMREFRVGVIPENPAIVLGPICGAHRAYLNGKFIGGSNFVFTLAYYSFDPHLLKRNEPNYLIVKIDPKNSITPGFISLPQVPAFLGEFSDVYTTVVTRETYYHVFQNIYLAMTLVCFFACLLFYLSNPMDRQYLYFACYLALGAMSLLYTNGFVAAFLDYRLQCALRLFGLSVSSMVLLSTYYYRIGQRKWEFVNNMLAVAWSSWLVFALIASPNTAGEYLDRWNFVMACTIGYSCLWVFGLFNYRMIRLLRDRNQWQEQLGRMRYEGVLLFFGILSAMLALGSIRSPLATAVVGRAIRNICFEVGTTSPFLFATCVLVLALADYIAKNRASNYRRRTDDLLLSVTDVIRNSESLSEAIPFIQKKVADFIHAERSTVYILDDQPTEPILTAFSIYGAHDAKTMIREGSRPRDGVLGYVCQSRAPLLIPDIAVDVRFREHVRNRMQSGNHTYKTNSCMLFPLMIGNRLFGILTMADKKDNATFGESDFALLHTVAKDIAIAVQSSALRRRLSA